jgi:hypothetical protein
MAALLVESAGVPFFSTTFRYSLNTICCIRAESTYNKKGGCSSRPHKFSFKCLSRFSPSSPRQAYPQERLSVREVPVAADPNPTCPL